MSDLSKSDSFRPALPKEAQYQAAQSAAVRAPRRMDLLEMTGSDSIDFLHRMSTNDILTIPPDEIRPTVLLTEKGRIIDVAWVVRRKDDILLLVSQGNASLIQAWLEKYIIMENIHLRDITAEHSMAIVIGSQIDSLSLHGSERSPGNSRVEVSSHRSSFGMLGARFLIAPEPSAPLAADLPLIDQDVYETIRSEEGIPQYPEELNEKVNPLEAGLRSMISFEKGCYIGQEVIARLDTYKKIQRTLVRFAFDSAERSVPTPGKIFTGATEAGWSTSHAWSYNLNCAIGLGYIQHDADREHLEIVSADGAGRFPIHLRPIAA